MKDGGPAFVVDSQDGCWPGISLRDYFATHVSMDDAMMPIVPRGKDDAADLVGWSYPSDGTFLEQLQWNIDFNVAVRYMLADAMLKAGEQHGQ